MSANEQFATDAVTSDLQALNSIIHHLPWSLHLEISDPEVVAELRKHADDESRSRYACTALRIGVLALRNASGQLDGRAINEAGDKLLGDIRELLLTRTGNLTGEVSNLFQRYLDPESGMFVQTLDHLVGDNGDLRRVLSDLIGPDQSALATTLANHLGDRSPLFKLLSPTEAEGLKAQLEGAIERALTEQKDRVLKEFSLDVPNSALSRLIRELREAQETAQREFADEANRIRDEFSLDKEGSALNCLIRRVETAQTTIANEFSTDNSASALNKISALLEGTRSSIDRHLTLDDEQSPLSRLRREFQASLTQIIERSNQFHNDVKETLTRLEARKEEGARSTRHGFDFESELGEMLAAEANRQGDIFKTTANTTGVIKNCKKGDHVTQIGPDCVAAGARVVWEAKENKSYDLQGALDEIEEARKNRQAQIGVFVFSKASAPDNIHGMKRYGNNLVVVWDDEDSSSDVLLHAAYSVSRALVTRHRAESSEAHKAVEHIELSVRVIEKQLSQFEEISVWAGTIKSNSQKILDRASKMQEVLKTEVETLDESIRALRLESSNE